MKNVRGKTTVIRDITNECIIERVPLFVDGSYEVYTVVMYKGVRLFTTVYDEGKVSSIDGFTVKAIAYEYSDGVEYSIFSLIPVKGQPVGDCNDFHVSNIFTTLEEMNEWLDNPK